MTVKEEILELIENRKIVEEVSSGRFSFTDLDYLKLIQKLIVKYQDVVRFLKGIEVELTDPKAIQLCKKCLKCLRSDYRNFTKYDDSYYFDVVLLDEDGNEKNRNLALSYKEAIETMKKQEALFEELDIEKSYEHCYKVIKRDYGFNVGFGDAIASMVFDEDFDPIANTIIHFDTILDILDGHHIKYDYLDFLANYVIKYPIVFKEGDVVKLGEAYYGVIIVDQEECDENVKIIDLEDEYILDEDLYAPGMDEEYGIMEHYIERTIDELDIIELDELPDNMRSNYKYFMDFYLDNVKKHNYS